MAEVEDSKSIECGFKTSKEEKNKQYSNHTGNEMINSITGIGKSLSTITLNAKKKKNP